jgi:hypothetical protein
LAAALDAFRLTGIAIDLALLGFTNALIDLDSEVLEILPALDPFALFWGEIFRAKEFVIMIKAFGARALSWDFNIAASREA